MWEKYDSVTAQWVAVGDVILVNNKVVHVTNVRQSFDIVHIDGYDDEWEEEYWAVVDVNLDIPLLIPA